MKERNTMENKTLNLSLSEDQQAIVACERKLNAAKRRLDETQREIARIKEDSELFDRPLNPDQIRALERQAKQDAELVAKLEADLREVKLEPERRAAREKHGAEVLRDGAKLVQQIEAWAESGAPLMSKAESLIQTVIDEFTVCKSGWHTMLPPFNTDEGRTLLERLRFFARTTGERGDGETFAQRIARYRRIVEPAKVVPPKPAAQIGVYARSKPLAKQARENAAVRSRMSPTGVVTESQR